MNNGDKREYSMVFQIFIRSSLIKLFSQQANGGNPVFKFVFGEVVVERKFSSVFRDYFELNCRFSVYAKI